MAGEGVEMFKKKTKKKGVSVEVLMIRVVMVMIRSVVMQVSLLSRLSALRCSLKIVASKVLRETRQKGQWSVWRF